MARVVELSLGLPEGTHPRLTTGGLAIGVARNADAGHADAGRWALAIEITPTEPVAHAAYVEALAAILRGLRSRELRVVTFWAFADDLPADGSDRKGRGRRI